MRDKNISSWINGNSQRKTILLAFSQPRTVRQVEIILSVRKLTLRNFINHGCLRCLNSGAEKGRFYVLSRKARDCLKPNCNEHNPRLDWETIGWIVSSHRMRLAILRSVDSRKLYSEEIRMIATQFNAKLSRTWTRNTLRQLEEKGLVTSEMLNHIRFYWISPHGQKIKDELAVIAPLVPSASSVIS